MTRKRKHGALTAPDFGQIGIDLFNATAQGAWWNEIQAIQKQFASEGELHDINLDLTILTALLNRDFMTPDWSASVSKDTTLETIKAYELKGFDLAFRMCAKLRAALHQDKVILPHFLILRLLIKPLSQCKPKDYDKYCSKLTKPEDAIELQEALLQTRAKTDFQLFEEDAIRYLQETIPFGDTKLLECIMQCNTSWYSDLEEARTIRYAKYAPSAPSADGILMWVLLIIFGGRLL